MDRSTSNPNGSSSISTILSDSVKTLDGSLQSAHSEVQDDRFHFPRSSNPNESSVISITPCNQLLVPSMSDGSHGHVLHDQPFVSTHIESLLPSPKESQDDQCLVPVTVDPRPRVIPHDDDNYDDHKSPTQIESAGGPSSSLGSRHLDDEHNEDDDNQVNFEKDGLSEPPCSNRDDSCNCYESSNESHGHRYGVCGQSRGFQFRSRWNGPWHHSRDRQWCRRENRDDMPLDFSLPMKETVVTGVGAGLSNLGNTCFINAILQCFTHTVSFVKALNSCNHLVPCQRAIDGFCVVCTLRSHIEVSLASSGKIISPSEVVDNLNYISSCFYRYQQEDAHEFLQCLLDKIEWCLISDLNSESSSFENDNIVKHVFGGRLVSKLLCCTCGHSSDKYEPFLDLSLEIEDVQTLQDALESFTKVEKIEDSDAKFRCDNCKKEVSMEKQLMVDQAPSVATLHLKRFKTDGSSIEKIGKHVEFPLDLDLKPYTTISQESNDSQANLKYHLYAVVVHNGFLPTSGHYFCYIRSSPNTWHKLDDSMVIKVDEEVVLSEAAYILLYAREGTAWFSSLIESQENCLDHSISNTSPKSVLDSMDTECTAYTNLANIDHCKASATVGDVEEASTHFPCVTVLEADQVNDKGNAAKGLSPHINEAGNGTGVISAHISCGPIQRGLKSCCDNKSIAGIPVDDVSVSLGAMGCPDGTLLHDKMGALASIDGNNCAQAANRNERNGLHPLTPPRSKSPAATNHIRRDHLKGENSVNSKRSTRAANDQRMEAVRLTRSMPSARKTKLLAAMNPQIHKKRRLSSSPCKQASPTVSHCKLNHRLAALR